MKLSPKAHRAIRYTTLVLLGVILTGNVYYRNLVASVISAFVFLCYAYFVVRAEILNEEEDKKKSFPN